MPNTIVMIKGALLWCATTLCWATSSLNVAQDYWPPYIMDTPMGQGIAHDIVTQGLTQGGYSFLYQHKPWARVLKETHYGKNDVIVSIWKNHDRERSFLFSVPYLYNDLAVITRSDNNQFQYQGVASLKGLKVAMIDNYAYPTALLEHPDIEPVSSSNLINSFRLLLSHRADVVVSDEFVALWTLKEAKLPRSRFHFSAKKFSTTSLHVAVRKSHPSAKQIVDSLNVYFQTLDESQLRQLKNKYGLEEINRDPPKSAFR